MAKDEEFKFPDEAAKDPKAEEKVDFEIEGEPEIEILRYRVHLPDNFKTVLYITHMIVSHLKYYQPVENICFLCHYRLLVNFFMIEAPPFSYSISGLWLRKRI